jgi:hypothetical protein
MQSVFSPEWADVHLRINELPLYEDFPYLVTRLVPALYHVIPLPEAFDEASLRSLARYQALCNQLPTCLVLGPTRGIYLDTDGKESDPGLPPRGGIVISDQLRPSPVVERDVRWNERSQRLRRYVDQQRSVRNSRYLLGDLTKGGRAASKEERRALHGTTENGIPRGLSQCLGCGEWRGRCLDPANPHNLVPVSCRCENVNRCAACLRPLAAHRLNANYFDIADGGVWHVPGFVACSHHCNDGFAHSA